MNSSRLMWAASTLALCAVAFPAAPAFAQAADGSAQLEEVVVTARKVEENLQSVPIAVTAFSGDQLKQQNTTRFADVARLTPGFTTREASSTPSAFNLAIRGQVQTDVLATLDPSVGTYVDGYYWARAYGLNTDLLDVQSVQVLKGPQGTLFGRNTTGGALVIQTNNPNLSSLNGEFYGAYGRFNERSGRMILNVPIVEDKAALRLAVQKSDRDGYDRDIVSGAKYPERDNITARAKLRLAPIDNLDIVLSAEYFDMDAATPSRRLFTFIPGSFASTAAGGDAVLNNFINTVSNSDDKVGMNVRPLTKARTHTYTGTVTYELDFVTLKYVGGFRKVESSSLLDLDGTIYPIHQTFGQQDLKQTSHELQATGRTLEGRLKYVLGGFYFTEEGVDGSQSMSVPLLTRLQIFSGAIDNTSKGIYGQATYQVNDKLSLTGGLRYSVEDKGLVSRNRILSSGVYTCQISTAVAPECAIGRSDQFKGTSYTASADYRFSDNSLVYVTTSSGFRSGGQNLRAPNAASFVPFAPEKAKNYEIGVKSEFFDRRVRLNAALYQTDVTDIQRTSLITILVPTVVNGVPTQVTSTATILANAGKARFQGLELEGTALVTPELQVAATASFVSPKYIRYFDASGDRRSERFEMVPERTFTVSAQYSRDIPWGGMTLRADYAWQSDMALQPQTTPANFVAAATQPEGGVLNARAALKVNDSLELAVFGRNLTDNRDTVSALNVAGLGYLSGIVREPLTYGVQATYSFGQ